MIVGETKATKDESQLGFAGAVFAASTAALITSPDRELKHATLIVGEAWRNPGVCQCWSLAQSHARRELTCPRRMAQSLRPESRWMVRVR
jgi:hypothetical protein